MRRRTIGAVAAGAVLVGGGTVLALTGRSAVDIPDDGPWLVVVAAGPMVPAECAHDWAVDLVLTPAIMPPGPASVSFVHGATHEDVERVVGCLTDEYPASSITVYTLPAR